jgi:hypothetical protein
MNKHRIREALSVLAITVCLCFFSSCSPGGSPSEEGYSGQIQVSGTLVSAGASSAPMNSKFSVATPTPLAGYKLDCVTTSTPVVEGSGVADANGNVTVVLKVRSASFGCSVFNPSGTKIATVIFSDASGTTHGQTISVSGDINLSTISVNLTTGEANATVPSNVSIGGGSGNTTYIISGQLSGLVLDGVTITISGAVNETTSTAAGGNYSFSGLANGSYTITPSLSGYTFSPASIQVTISGASVAGIDFTATTNHQTYSTYFHDYYGSPIDGPYTLEIVEDESGELTVTAVDVSIVGYGTKSGNDINFTLPMILCNDWNPSGHDTGTAVFTGTIGVNGQITGTVVDTLSPGDTCRENGSSIYEGTFQAIPN